MLKTPLYAVKQKYSGVECQLYVTTVIWCVHGLVMHTPP